MPIYKPSELRSFLDSHGIFPKKGFSQNFLIDGNIIRKIVAVSKVTPDDIILEIGPGPGSLTEELIATGAHVIAVEKDRALAHALERFQSPPHQLTIFCDDILTFPIEKELSTHIGNGKRGKVIANLPYHLTTPILAQLVSMRETFTSLTVMVQEEVARRMTASPGSSEYSSMSLFLNFYTTPHYAFKVTRQCFYPIPKVDSAVVVLQLKEPPLTKEASHTFFQLTRTAFKQRRKMLKVSLRDLFPVQAIENALKAIGEDLTARPETLSLEKFLQLHALLNTNPPDQSTYENAN